MEDINILQTILGYIDIIYIVMCNIITYVIINSIQIYYNNIKLKRWVKRSISALIGVLLGIVIVVCFGHNTETVFYSFFIQFLTWDYVIKEIKNKLQSK